MASLTQKTRFRRNLRKKNAGKKRKARARTLGTTPAFAIHTPEADNNAPDQAKKA